MRSFILTRFAAVALLLGAFQPAQAQVKPTRSDTTEKYQNPSGVSSGIKAPFFKSKLFKAVAIPAVLITYGAITAQGDAGVNHSSQDFVRKQFRPVNTMIDNTVIFLPYLELGAVALAGHRGGWETRRPAARCLYPRAKHCKGGSAQPKTAVTDPERPRPGRRCDPRHGRNRSNMTII